MRAAALLCALAGAAACARPYAPPGGERDVVPPGLVSTTPAALAIVPASDEPVIFRFDERISERGFSEALFNVSPLDSALRIDRSGSEVKVGIDGGWRPNRVYRVVLLPGLRDLFGNERRAPVELVFSTGAPVGNTALAGMVTDRLTGAPARAGVVDAVHAAEGARYTAIADSSGFYSLRYLPVGAYDVRAYDDQNGNRRRDGLEPVDSGHSVVFDQPIDTVALIFSVLSPDTIAPRAMNAAALDSLHVRVEFDDHFDPAVALEAVTAQVHALPDSVPYASAVRVMPAAVFIAEQQAAAEAAAAAQAAADSVARAAADSAARAADTAGVVLPPPDTMRQPTPVRPAGAVRAGPVRQGDEPGRDPDLPTREIVIQLDRPLRPGSYAITVVGIVNLHGLAGGGTITFDVSAPPSEDRPPPLPAPPLPAPPDTGGAARRF